MTVASIPTLDDPVEIGPDVVDGLQSDGPALVRRLPTPEDVAPYRPHLVAAAQERNREARTTRTGSVKGA